MLTYYVNINIILTCYYLFTICIHKFLNHISSCELLATRTFYVEIANCMEKAYIGHHLWDKVKLKLEETLKDLDYPDKITASIHGQAKHQLETIRRTTIT